MTRSAQLTAKLLDGTLTESEWVELESLLATDPSAEAEHLALLELEVELRGLRNDFDLTEATLAQVQEAQAELTAQAVMDEIASGPPPTWAVPSVSTPQSNSPSSRVPNRYRRRMLLAAAMIACAAAIVLGLWFDGRNPNEPQPESEPAPMAFAKLSRKAGAVEVVNPAGEAILAEEGGELPAGFTLRTVGEDSLAVVELLRDQTRVEIESDSVVRFAGDAPESAGMPRMFLAAGQLTAAVRQRPEDRPLIVGTAVAEVFGRGGTFVVSSAGPDSARIDNKQGKVDLVRAAAPRPVSVAAGGAAVIHAGIDRLYLERSAMIDRAPKRALAYLGYRDAVFSPDGSEVWVATAKVFGRWSATGGFVETGFYPRKGDGVAAFTRDRRFLVTFRGERDDSVLVRTVPDAGEFASINARPTDSRFWAVAPDASWLAIIESKPNNRRVRVFDGGMGDERFLREFEDNLTCLAAAPNGKSLAVAVHTTVRGVSNKVVFLDALTSDRLFALSVLKRPVTAMTFSADGRFLAVGFNGTVQVWDVGNQELARSITGFERVPTCLTFSPDGKRLAAGTQDGHVWLWDVETGRQTQLIEVGGRGLRSIAFSPNSKQLVTVATGAPVAVWDVVDRSLAPDLQ